MNNERVEKKFDGNLFKTWPPNFYGDIRLQFAVGKGRISNKSESGQAGYCIFYIWSDIWKTGKTVKVGN